MSKLLTPIILLILLLSLYSTAVSAHDIEVKNADGVTIYYIWINNNTEVAVSHRGDASDSYKNEYSGNVDIPETVNYNGINYRVTSIDSDAFSGCSGLTSITIPNGVTSIGFQAFVDCSGLTSITIPNSVTSISGSAFLDCSGLISITIPNGVTSIGFQTFSSCSGLSSITIPNSVTSIGNYAFSGCSGLTSITIPNGVTSIGSQAFSGCSGLTTIVVEGGNSVYDSRDNCNAIIETHNNKLSVGCKNTIIPNSVTSIGYMAFSGCSGLTYITIPNSVTSIDNYAFSNCSGLTYITIPNRTTSIGDWAFSGCSGLTSVTIPNSVTSIGDGAFSSCIRLTSVISKIQHPFEIVSCFDNSIYSKATLTIPKGTKAAYQATEGWNKFVNIVEESATENILFTVDGTTYQGSKSDNTALVKSVDPSLMSLEIPSSVRYDGRTFQVTSIADYAFKGCSLNYLSLPATITTLTEETFSGCSICAMSWNANTELFLKAFRNTTMSTDYNFLLYVNSADYAPQTVKNVIVGNTAETITLSDSGDGFYCPIAFTAKKISYTHHFGMETGGYGKGWETIALPFDVQKITHSSNGEIVPFASYDAKSNQKPFWLYGHSGSNFLKASSIRANEAYLIAMPNQTSYKKEYNLSGDVTFSAENVRIPITPEAFGPFVPTFSKIEKSNSIKVLNVVNKYVNETGGFDAGSRFISNLRDVRPFECYLKGNGSTRSVDDMIVDNKR